MTDRPQPDMDNAKKETLSHDPDTPEQAATRRRYEAELRNEYGDVWMKEHARRLDREWEYMKANGFV